MPMKTCSRTVRRNARRSGLYPWHQWLGLLAVEPTRGTCSGAWSEHLDVIAKILGGLGSRHNWGRIKTVPVRRRLSVGIGIDFRRGHWAASKLTQRCRLHRRLTPTREHQPKSMVRSPRSRLTCLKLGSGNGRASHNGAGCARFRQHRRTCTLPRARHRPRPWRSTHSCVTMNVARCYGLFVPQARGRQRRLSGLHCCFVYPLG